MMDELERIEVAAKMEATQRLDEKLIERRPMRPLLIGEAPSRTGEGWPALTGRAGDQLAELSGLPVRPGCRLALSLMLAAERVNVFRRWPGREGRGSAFPMRDARLRARLILRRMAAAGRLEGRRVVFVGDRVAGAFGFLPGPYGFFSWRICDLVPTREGRGASFLAAKIQHPSGLNHYWNSRERTEAAARFCWTIFADEDPLPVDVRIVGERGERLVPWAP